MTRFLSIAAVLALASPWAAAQAVYRCGNSYGTQPCAGASVVEAAAAPSKADAAHAAKVAIEDARRAEAMEKARLAQEKNAPKAIVMGPKEPPAKAASAPGGHARDKKHKGKADDPDVYTATAPGTGSKKAAKGK